MPRSARFARGRRRFGSLSSTLASLWHQSRCHRRLRPHVPQRRPEAQRPVPNRHRRRAQTTPPQVPQHARPALVALPVAVLQRHQLLRPVRPHPDHHQRAQTVLLKPDVEVNPVDPDVDVVAPRQVAPPERLVLLVPRRCQPRDGRRAQTRRVLPQQRRQRLPEVSRRQTPPIQQRQHLGNLRGAAHIRRQNAAGEPLPGTVGINPLVVHPRRPHLPRARSAGHCALPRLAVPHHQPPPVGVAHLREALDVLRHLGLQGRHQHPPCPLASQRIEGRRLVPWRVLVAAADPLTRQRRRGLVSGRGVVFVPVVGYRQHGWCLLPPRRAS